MAPPVSTLTGLISLLKNLVFTGTYRADGVNGVSDNIRQLITKSANGDESSFARLLTKIEELGPSVLSENALLKPKSLAYRVGITGPPGAGKSTLVNELIAKALDKKLKIGVLAVDPSSPFSKGAILGDRIRFSNLSKDKGVFVRSIGSRGSLGGLCAQAYLMLRAFDAAGFDIVFVETVGVGQTEWEIMHVADAVGVVLVPESGDGVQAMKAGLMEIADFFIVNKSDRQGANSLVNELNRISTEEKEVRVFQTVASEGRGVSEVLDFFLGLKKTHLSEKMRSHPNRLRSEAIALHRLKMDQTLIKKASRVRKLSDLKREFVSK